MGLPALTERESSVVYLHLPTAVIIQHTRYRAHVRLDWIGLESHDNWYQTYTVTGLIN